MVAVGVGVEVAVAMPESLCVAVSVLQMIGNIRVFLFHRGERVKKCHA